MCLKSGEEESNLPKESVPKPAKVFQKWQMSGVVQVTVINSGGIFKMIRLTCIKLKPLQQISQASMSIPGIIGSVNHMHEP